MSNQLLKKPSVQKNLGKEALDALLPKKFLQLEKLDVKGYENVVKATDKASGLQAIIAIHSTVMGPALGGIRIHPYASFDQALEDVLRLSKGMTYKAVLSEVGFGGGKSVVIADPKKKTPALLAALGRAVEQLQGEYICAEDVGCSVDDVEIVRRYTQHVVGLPHSKSSGNPGPFTSWGVFRGIQSVAQKMFGSSSLEGRTIAIQGLGSVGGFLAEYLFWAGANLILSDLDMDKVESLAFKYNAKILPSSQILQAECDILAPCAMGGIFHDESIPTLRCKAIAGGANNQLLAERHGEQLRKRGILYAPDFVINAGGLLNVSCELAPEGYSATVARSKVHKIYDTLLSIYEIAEKNGESTHAAAVALADYRLKYAIGKRVLPPTFHHAID